MVDDRLKDAIRNALGNERMTAEHLTIAEVTINYLRNSKSISEELRQEIHMEGFDEGYTCGYDAGYEDGTGSRYHNPNRYTVQRKDWVDV